MPIYSYECQGHGIFSELVALNDYKKPLPCPKCSVLCQRTINVPPALASLSKEARIIHETNERSRHEPAYSTRERRLYDEKHTKNCGCNRPLSQSKTAYTATGKKTFPSMRPWMISH